MFSLLCADSKNTVSRRDQCYRVQLWVASIPWATPTAGTQNGHQEEHTQDVSVWESSCTEWRHQHGKHQSWQEAFVAAAALCSSSGEQPRNFFLLKFCPGTEHRKPEWVTWRKFAKIKSQLQLNMTQLFMGLFFLYTVLKEKKLCHCFSSQNIDVLFGCRKFWHPISGVVHITSHGFNQSDTQTASSDNWHRKWHPRGPEHGRHTFFGLLRSVETELYRTFEKRIRPFWSITLGSGMEGKRGSE